MYMNNTVFLIDRRDKMAFPLGSNGGEFEWSQLKEMYISSPYLPATHQPMLQDDTQVQSNEYCVGTF